MNNFHSVLSNRVHLFEATTGLHRAWARESHTGWFSNLFCYGGSPQLGARKGNPTALTLAESSHSPFSALVLNHQLILVHPSSCNTAFHKPNQLLFPSEREASASAIYSSSNSLATVMCDRENQYNFRSREISFSSVCSARWWWRRGTGYRKTCTLSVP